MTLYCSRTNPSPRNEWPLGRIQEVERSNDGLARSVKLKTKNGVLRSPVNKLVLLLPTEEQHDYSDNRDT